MKNIKNNRSAPDTLTRKGWIRILSADPAWNIELDALPEDNERRVLAMGLLGEMADILVPGDGLVPDEKQNLMSELHSRVHSIVVRNCVYEREEERYRSLAKRGPGVV